MSRGICPVCGKQKEGEAIYTSIPVEFVIVMAGVSEFAEGFEVELVCYASDNHRWAIRARNEGGCNETRIDFWEFIKWLRTHDLPFGLKCPYLVEGNKAKEE